MRPPASSRLPHRAKRCLMVEQTNRNIHGYYWRHFPDCQQLGEAQKQAMLNLS
jgi:hypothetical protein